MRLLSGWNSLEFILIKLKWLSHFFFYFCANCPLTNRCGLWYNDRPHTSALGEILICQVVSTFSRENARSKTSVRFSQNQRAAHEGIGSIFRSPTPICNFFATSSDLYMRSVSPETDTPSRRSYARDKYVN